MTPKQDTRAVVVEADIGALRTKLVSGLGAMGIDVALVERTYIEFRRGSHASYRLKGAMLCRPEEMPIVGGCQLAETADGRTSCEVTIRDEHAFGARIGTNKKFDAAIADALRIVIHVALSADPNPQTNPKE